jgi:DeoR/GlpR family transcriptional regulator of sugar metabolism
MKEKNLFQEERLRIIYETVQQKNKVLVNDLAEEFSISKTTARNDLMELESRGLITRTHGGAILRNSDSELQKEIVRDNVPVTERISDRLDEKKNNRKTRCYVNQ